MELAVNMEMVTGGTSLIYMRVLVDDYLEICVCNNFVCRWDNEEVEKLSPWDLVPLDDCSMSAFHVSPFC